MLAAVRNSSSALWYLSRGTGVVVLVLLTASVVLGVLLSVRWRSRAWPRFITNGLHRNISLLVLAFLGLHIATAVLDPFAGIGWVAAVVPMASNYRPIWLGLGALAFDLLLAIVITSLFRTQIGLRAWRAVHWLTYAAWPVALVHGMGTGTDVKTHWMLAVDAACLVAVVLAVGWRLADLSRPDAGDALSPSRGLLAWTAMLGTFVVALIVGFLVVGPLRPGWASRSGTPKHLLAASHGVSSAGGTGTVSAGGAGAGGGAVAGGASSSSSSSSLKPSSNKPPADPGWPAAGFTARMDGTLTQTTPDAQSNTTVTLTSRLTQGASGTLVIVLHGQALGAQGVSMTSSNVTGGPAGHPTQYTGRVTGLNGTQVDVSLRDGAGHRLTMALDVRIGADGSSFVGALRAQPSSARTRGGDGGG